MGPKAVDKSAGNNSRDADFISPHEILYIRRLLTLYLASFITFPREGTTPDIQLRCPEAAEAVAEYPSAIKGIRKQYLEAVQANIAARERYKTVASAISQDDDISSGPPSSNEGPERLKTHLHLLQMRVRRNELRIRRHYLERLEESNPAKNGHLDLQLVRKAEGEETPLSDPDRNDNAQLSETNLHDLTMQLQRAVVQATYKLEREKQLLAAAKAHHELETSSGWSSTPQARIEALNATKNELIEWIEEKLALANLEDDTGIDETGLNSEPKIESETAVTEMINSQYEQYLEARQKALEVAARAIAPSQQSEAGTASTNTPALQPRANRPWVLPFLAAQVKSLERNQVCTHTINNYTSENLGRVRAHTLETLGRLADESQLLSAYPMTVGQDKPKHEVVGLKPHPVHELGEDEQIKRAQAWAFAAREAQATTDGVLAEQVKAGNERLVHTANLLHDLEELLGMDPESGQRPDPADETDDIWVQASQLRGNRSGTPRPPEGPWAHLYGKVGTSETV